MSAFCQNSTLQTGCVRPHLQIDGLHHQCCQVHRWLLCTLMDRSCRCSVCQTESPVRPRSFYTEHVTFETLFKGCFNRITSPAIHDPVCWCQVEKSAQHDSACPVSFPPYPNPSYPSLSETLTVQRRSSAPSWVRSSAPRAAVGPRSLLESGWKKQVEKHVAF